MSAVEPTMEEVTAKIKEKGEELVYLMGLAATLPPGALTTSQFLALCYAAEVRRAVDATTKLYEI